MGTAKGLVKARARWTPPPLLPTALSFLLPRPLSGQTRRGTNSPSEIMTGLRATQLPAGNLQKEAKRDEREPQEGGHLSWVWRQGWQAWCQLVVSLRDCHRNWGQVAQQCQGGKGSGGGDPSLPQKRILKRATAWVLRKGL